MQQTLIRENIYVRIFLRPVDYNLRKVYNIGLAVHKFNKISE